MNAFHTFWTKPLHDNIRLHPHEVLVLILSALEWRKHNGSIRLFTDVKGRDYIYEIGLQWLWDDGISRELEGSIPPDINIDYYWAAGKIYALKCMEEPCVMLDMDMIIWKDISNLLGNTIIAAHEEPLSEDIYPDPHLFSFKNDYKLNLDWDFNLKPANTSFLYIPHYSLYSNSYGFKDRYCYCACEIFKNLVLDNMNKTTAMVFAEQRLLPMCAKEYKAEIKYLINREEFSSQNILTHIWGNKNYLNASPEASRYFCQRCLTRISKDFPNYYEKAVSILKNLPSLERSVPQNIQ